MSARSIGTTVAACVPTGFRHLSRSTLLWPFVLLMVLLPPAAAWAQLDYGDAPDQSNDTPPGALQYPTLLSSGGARHTLGGTLFLGAAVDADTNGFFDGTDDNGNATDDDSQGTTPDDEDGISFGGFLIRGEAVTVTVAASGVSVATPGILYAWIDYNLDGDWADANEYVIKGQSITDTTTDIAITIPSGATPGTSYARFRLTTDTLTSSGYSGLATDGEVEDYEVAILATDFGDAPASYDTLRADDGPRHGITGTGPILGSIAPDADSNGFGDGTDDAGDGSDDDAEGATPDDEDAFAAPIVMVRGDTTALSVPTTGSGYLRVWVDFDANGSFDAGEALAAAQSFSSSPVSVSGFQVPWDAVAGPTFARLRVASNADELMATGLAQDGEVEDHPVIILPLDFGDAPAALPTLASANGARHAVPDPPVVYLGAAVDVDTDGFHDGSDANGDATDDDAEGTTPDDEDGVSFGSDLNDDLVAGQQAWVVVTTSAAGNLSVWIDLNGDGDWADTGEKVIADHAFASAAAAEKVTFSIPSHITGVTTPGITTYARVRFSSDSGLAATGQASDGEVEDYQVVLAPVADLEVTATDNDLDAVPGGERQTYTIVVTNNGPNDVVGAQVSDVFGADFLSPVWSCAAGAGGGTCGQVAGIGDIAAGVDLANGEAVTLTAHAWVAPAAAGAACAGGRCLANTVEVVPPSSGGVPEVYDIDLLDGLDDGDNNRATDSDTVLTPRADLQVFKSNNQDGLSPGQSFDYTVRVVNAGPSSVWEGVVEDDLPDDTTAPDSDPVDLLDANPVACGAAGNSPCWECAPSPALVFVERHEQPPVTGLEGASRSLVSPDGKHVYVAAVESDSIVTFARETDHTLGSFGALSWVQTLTDGAPNPGQAGDPADVDGLDAVRGLALSPGGRHLYSVGAADNAISVFRRDASTGALAMVEVQFDGVGPVDGLAGARSVAVSPDGGHVYAAGADDNAVAVFERDPATGQLTFVEALVDGATQGAATIDGLAGATAVAVSPDGGHVYVAGAVDNAVAVFERDSATGQLTFVEALVDGATQGAATIDGLAGVRALAFDPTGEHLYAASAVDSAVAFLSRDASLGTLTYEAAYKSVDPGLDGLAGAETVLLTPDASLVIVGGSADSSLAVFVRDPVSGELGFLQWFQETTVTPGEAGPVEIPGLGNVSGLSVSPDGGHLLVSGGTPAETPTNALTVLRLAAGGDCDSAAGVATSSGTGDILTDGAAGNQPPVILPAGAFVEYTVHCKVTAGVTQDVVNTASASAAEPADLVDWVASNDSAQDLDELGLEIDVSIVKTGDAVAVPGSAYTYSIEVANAGPQDVNGILVSDPFPAVVSGVEWSCSGNGGVCPSPATGVGDLVDESVNLPAGGAVVFTATGVIAADASADIVNSATFTKPAGYFDSDSTNDVGTHTISPSLTADLAVTIGHSALVDVTGGASCTTTFSYTIAVTNGGPSWVPAALVSDLFPAQLTQHDWTCAVSGGAGSCEAASGTGDLDEEISLAPGATATFVVNAGLPCAETGVLVNRVSVDAGTASDPEPVNDSAEDRVALTATADLAITKDDGSATAIPGEPIAYTLTVTNSGEDDAFEAQVVDLFSGPPAFLTDVSWTCDPTPPVPGDLEYLQTAQRNGGPSDLALSPDGAQLYEVNADADSLVAYTRLTDPGINYGKLAITPLDIQEAGQGDVPAVMDEPRAVLASPDGYNVYVAAGAGDAVLVFQRQWSLADEDYGKLSFVEAIVDGDVQGSATVDGLDGAYGMALSADGLYLYVASSDDSSVAVFERDPASGRLTFVTNYVDGVGGVDGIQGARDVVLSPDGLHVYVSGSADNAVALFERDAASGELSWVASTVDGSGGVDGLNGVTDLELSGDGRHLYAAGSGEDAVAMLERDPATGALTFRQVVFAGEVAGIPGIEGLENVASLAVAPIGSEGNDGQHLVAGGHLNGKLVVFRRNVTTGRLSFQERIINTVPTAPGGTPVDGLANTRSVRFSSDGLNLYAAGHDDDALVVFMRRQPAPAFTFVEADTNGAEDGWGNTIQGLFGARAVAVDRDGLHVYAAGFADDAVVVFERDKALGLVEGTEGQHLRFVTAVHEGDVQPSGTVDGLDGAAALALSQDGSNVYVASEADNAVAVFQRDAVSGELSFVELEKDGVNGANGLAGAVAVAVSQDGDHVYVAGQYEASVAVFERGVNGALTFVERKVNGVDSVQGLAGVSGVIVAPDNDHVYAVSRIDDAVVCFARNADGTLDFMQVLRDGVAADGLDQARGVAMAQDVNGEWSHLLVAAAGDSSVAVFERNTDPDSSQYGRLKFVQVVKDGDMLAGKEVDGLAGARGVAVSADGLNVFVVGEFDNALAVFARINDPFRPDFGELSFVESSADEVDGVDGLQQAYGVTVSGADNANVYVAGLGDSAVASFASRTGSRCTPSGVGDINDTVDIGFGGTLTYTVLATVAPYAQGTLVNEAWVLPPPGTTDEDLVGVDLGSPGPAWGDNFARDEDAITPLADMRVDKTDGVLSAVAGTTTTYTIRVNNSGPSNAVAARISDPALSSNPDFAEVSWSCLAIGSGALQLAQVVENGDEHGALTVDGLDGASGVAVSADGAFVYAVGLVDDALVAFNRDLATGELTVRSDFFRDGVDMVDGLDGASDVTTFYDEAGTPLDLTDDFVSIYVAAQVDDAVAVFTHDLATDVVSFNEWWGTAAAGGAVDGLDQATAVTVSPDGGSVYVAGANDDAIVIFERQADGTLSVLSPGSPVASSSWGLDGVSDLVVAADGFLYATGYNSGAVAVFQRDPLTGALSFREKKDGTSALAGANAVALSPDGGQLYVGGAVNGSLVVFSRTAGSLSSEQVVNEGDDGLFGLVGVASLVVGPNGAHVYAAGQASDSVVLFSRDEFDGTLTHVDTYRNGLGGVTGIDGVSALAVSPVGEHLYAAALTDDALTVFERAFDSDCTSSGVGAIDDLVNVAAGGRLVYTVQATLRSGAEGTACPAPFDGARQCVVNDAWVEPGLYAETNPANDSSSDVDYLGARADLAISKADQWIVHAGLRGATAVAVEPATGSHVYVASATDSAVAVLGRNAGDGSLEFLGYVRDDEDGVDGIGGANAVAISANGRHAYVAGPQDNAVAVFDRDSATGALSFREVEINGLAGVSGLLGASAVRLSRDGAQLYVAGANANAVAVFDRVVDDESDDYGELNFSSFVQNGSGGVDRMLTPMALVESPDERYLYVAAAGSDAVVVFERDSDPDSATYGELDFVASVADGDPLDPMQPQGDAVDGLAGAAALSFDADGDHLFVAGADDDAVAAMQRNLQTGELAYLHHIAQGDQVGEPDGLVGVRSLARGSGDALYCAGSGSDAVAVLTWDEVSETLSFAGVVHEGDDQAGTTVAGLHGPRGLALSPGGAHIYVAASLDHAVTALAHTGGEPEFIATYRDGDNGAPPGAPGGIVYTITVTNNGPSDVFGATVEDIFDDSLVAVEWQCLPASGSTCYVNGTQVDDINATVDIEAGAELSFIATVTTRADATGMLSNTASVAAPAGLVDPDLGNNSATDDDTLLTPRADLAVSKQVLGDLVPGDPVSYEIVVSNATNAAAQGYSFALDNVLVDRMPEALTDVWWECVGEPLPGLLNQVVDGGWDPVPGASDATVAADNRSVYAVAATTGELLVFGRDPRSGVLDLLQTFTDGVGGIDGLSGAVAVVVSPDDASVYVAGELDDAVAVFSRDTATGELEFLEVQRDGAGVVNGLGGVRHLALSPNGRQLYAAGAADNAVAIFDRDLSTSGFGRLDFVGVVQQGAGVTGLSGVAAVTLDSSGSYLYAAGALSNAIAVFARNPSDGTLSFVHSLGTAAAPGLAGASSVAVSPDDLNLIAAGKLADALVVLDIDPDTGRLSFLEEHVDGVDGVSGLAGASRVVFSPDGRQVYAAGSLSGAVAAFERDPASGELHFAQALSNGDPVPGDPGGAVVSGLGGVRALGMSGDGFHIYAAGATDGAVATLARLPGSTCAARGVGDVLDTLSLVPGGSATYTVHGILLPSATGEVVNVASVIPGPTVVDPVTDNNRAETVNNMVAPAADLELSKDDGLLSVVAGEAISYTLRLTNNGPSDAVGATLTDAFPFYDAVTAGLKPGSVSWSCASSPGFLQEDLFVDGSPDVSGLAGAGWIAVSPDTDGPGGEAGGDHVYVTGVDDDAISVFALDPVTGSYQPQQLVRDGDEIQPGIFLNGLDGASGVAISPDGAHVYAVGAVDDALAVFARETDPAAADYGNLNFVESFVQGLPFEGLRGATGVTVSPDGAHVYVASKESNAVLVFARNQDELSGSFGRLNYVERQREGVGDVPLLSLQGARDLVLTPDGAHLYVAAQAADAVCVFARDPITGRLSFVEVVRNLDLQGPVGNEVTVNGLDLVRSLATSPGGRFVYAASMTDDAVVLFDRDDDELSDSYGALSFVTVYRDGEAGVSGLDGATDVSLSPDGSFLYVAGLNAHSVAVFAREWSSGQLVQVEQMTDGAPGVEGLAGANAVAVTPDGSRLLVTGRYDNALAVFLRQPQSFCGGSAGSGDVVAIDEILSLRAGSTVTITVDAVVHPSARGVLDNQATVSYFADPDLGNNTGIDNDTVIQVLSDLGVTKTNGIETAVAGTPLSYTVVVSNAGPSDAFDLRLEDPLPTSLLGCSCTRSDGVPCVVGGGNLIDDTVDFMAVGRSITYTMACMLSPGADSDLANTASVLAEDPAHDPAGTPGALPNQATDVDAVAAISDLALSKQNFVDEVIPGEPVVYEVQVTNLGPSNLPAGRVLDELPSQLVNPSWICLATPPTGTCTPGPVSSDVVDDVVSIPVGGSVTYLITSLVDPAVTGIISNTASVEVIPAIGNPDLTAIDPELSNNVDHDVDPLRPVADISVVKTDDVDPAVTGGQLVYTLTVSNVGPSYAHDVVATEALPAGVTLLGTVGCANDPAGVPSCDLGDLANADSVQYTVSVAIDEGLLGVITNQASVVSASDDPQPLNNAASETTQVDPWADLALSKTDSVDPVVAGTELEYTLSVSNPGPYAAQAVVVSESLPLGVTPLGTTGCAEDGDPGGGIPNCTLGTIAAGGSAQYTLRVEVDSSTIGSMVNDASVASDWFDPNLVDNDASEGTEVIAEADLWVMKTNCEPLLTPAMTVVYTLEVGNDGPSDAALAQVSDDVPVELVNVSWTCAPSGGAFCSPSGMGNVLSDSVSIPVGDGVVYNVTGTVDPLLDPSTGVSVLNTVVVGPTGDLTDPETANNQSSDDDRVVAGLIFAGDFECDGLAGWSAAVKNGEADGLATGLHVDDEVGLATDGDAEERQ